MSASLFPRQVVSGLCPAYRRRWGHLQDRRSSGKIQGDELIPGAIIPSFQNCHSHLFQYAMAGLLEYSEKGKDDFWSWRTTMYQVANQIDPDQLLTIARVFFQQSISLGYTHHVEFHYLHHDKNGDHYSQRNILAEAIVKAANETGIGLTLIPIFYCHGNFNTDILPEQKRFFHGSVEDFAQHVESIKDLQNQYQFILGHGVHSLRAATLDQTKDILNNGLTQGPTHIHISEQVKEVDDFKQLFEKRPVQWLLENISQPTNLVHGTHLNDDEVEGLLESLITSSYAPQLKPIWAMVYFHCRTITVEVAVGASALIAM